MRYSVFASSTGGPVRRPSPRASSETARPHSLRQLGEHGQAGRARPRSASCRASTAWSSRPASRAELAAHQSWNSSGVTPRCAGVAADLVERGEPEPAVERGVLDALGHHRAAGLLEAHHELVPVRAAAAVAERERGDQVERVVPLLGQLLVGRGCGGVSTIRRDGVRRRLARDDVGAVDGERDQQLDERLAQPAAGVVAQLEVVVADRGSELDEPVPPRRAGRARRPNRLASSTTGCEVARLAGQRRVEVAPAARRRAGSTNNPPTRSSASYPVVPAHGQSAGSSSSPSRIFSTTTHAPPVAACSRRR